MTTIPALSALGNHSWRESSRMLVSTLRSGAWRTPSASTSIWWTQGPGTSSIRSSRRPISPATCTMAPFARSGFARVVQRVYKKSPGASATFCHMGHVVMENRNGLVAATEMTQAAGAAERDAAIAMVEEVAGSHRITLGADKFKSNYIQRGTTDSRCFSIGPKCSARVSASQGRGRQQRQGC